MWIYPAKLVKPSSLKPALKDHFEYLSFFAAGKWWHTIRMIWPHDTRSHPFIRMLNCICVHLVNLFGFVGVLPWDKARWNLQYPSFGFMRPFEWQHKVYLLHHCFTRLIFGVGVPCPFFLRVLNLIEFVWICSIFHSLGRIRLISAGIMYLTYFGVRIPDHTENIKDFPVRCAKILLLMPSMTHEPSPYETLCLGITMPSRIGGVPHQPRISSSATERWITTSSLCALEKQGSMSQSSHRSGTAKQSGDLVLGTSGQGDDVESLWAYGPSERQWVFERLAHDQWGRKLYRQ